MDSDAKFNSLKFDPESVIGLNQLSELSESLEDLLKISSLVNPENQYQTGVFLKQLISNFKFGEQHYFKRKEDDRWRNLRSGHETNKIYRREIADYLSLKEFLSLYVMPLSELKSNLFEETLSKQHGRHIAMFVDGSNSYTMLKALFMLNKFKEELSQVNFAFGRFKNPLHYDVIYRDYRTVETHTLTEPFKYGFYKVRKFEARTNDFLDLSYVESECSNNVQLYSQNRKNNEVLFYSQGCVHKYEFSGFWKVFNELENPLMKDTDHLLLEKADLVHKKPSDLNIGDYWLCKNSDLLNFSSLSSRFSLDFPNKLISFRKIQKYWVSDMSFMPVYLPTDGVYCLSRTTDKDHKFCFGSFTNNLQEMLHITHSEDVISKCEPTTKENTNEVLRIPDGQIQSEYQIEPDLTNDNDIFILTMVYKKPYEKLLEDSIASILANHTNPPPGRNITMFIAYNHASKEFKDKHKQM